MDIDSAYQRSEALTTLLLTAHLSHAPERVFDALTDPAVLEEWLAVATLDTYLGGRVSLVWPGEGEMNGEVTEFVGGTTLAYSWQEEHASHVKWTVTPSRGGTTLALVHSRIITDDDAIGLGAGWQSHVEALDDVLTGRPTTPSLRSDRYNALKPHYRELYATALS